MVEAEFPRVKEKSWGGEGMFFGVDGIAEDGGADVLEVDPDVVGAAGVEVAQNKSGFGGLIGSDDLIIGDRGFPGGWGDHGHFLTIHRMPADVGEDRVFVFQGDAIGDGEVDFLHRRTLRKLGGETLVGGVGFRDDEAAGSIFIKTMHDAGSLHSADAGKFSSAMMEQGIDKGAVGISGCGMDDHAVGFVENDEMFVFKKDIKRDVLRVGDVRNGFRDDDGNFIAGRNAVARFGGFAVE